MNSGPKKEFDYKTIGIAAVLSGSLGIGGGYLNQGAEKSDVQKLNDDVEAYKIEIKDDFAVLEARGEKRYKRGIEFGKDLKREVDYTEAEVEELRVDLGKAEANVQNLKERIERLEK